jgi:hypothetical protein
MPGSGTSTFIDPDDYQASLDRVPLDLLLVMSRGEFRGLGDKRKAESPLSVAQRGGCSADRLRFVVSGARFVGFPARSSPPIVWGGVELHPGEIVLHSRAERFHQRTAGPCGG